MIYIDNNGITVKAKKEAVKGNTYILNGNEYYVVKDEWDLIELIQQDQGQSINLLLYFSFY